VLASALFTCLQFTACNHERVWIIQRFAMNAPLCVSNALRSAVCFSQQEALALSQDAALALSQEAATALSQDAALALSHDVAWAFAHAVWQFSPACRAGAANNNETVRNERIVFMNEMHSTADGWPAIRIGSKEHEVH
jgi:hypothetical protein